MSLKENVNYIKEEITTQESFIENFFKLEKFYKKFKILIISSVVVIIVSVIGFQSFGYIQEQNRLEANELFNSCIVDSSDTKSFELLKSKNVELYNLAMYVVNKKSNIDKEFINELVAYSDAMKNKDLKQLDSSIQNQNFLLKDFAIFNKALIQVQNGQNKEAKETIKLIPITSSVTSLVKMLEHYMLTK